METKLTHQATLFDVLTEVGLERQRQDAKWGQQDHSPERWITILGEEYGEACRGCYEAWRNGMTLADYRDELVQVAAVAVAAIECLDRQAA